MLYLGSFHLFSITRLRLHMCMLLWGEHLHVKLMHHDLVLSPLPKVRTLWWLQDRSSFLAHTTTQNRCLCQWMLLPSGGPQGRSFFPTVSATSPRLFMDCCSWGKGRRNIYPPKNSRLELAQTTSILYRGATDSLFMHTLWAVILTMEVTHSRGCL